MYIIFAVCLVAIAAYYPIKLIKFYCMESFEQGLKAKITRDLREGRVSPNLILLTIGAGGLRLTRNQLDVIFEWMVQNTNAWKVHTYADEKIVVVFAHSPFHPEEWGNYEDYKHVMRQMFGDYGTRDFLTCRTTMREMILLKKEIRLLEKKEPEAIDKFDYVIFNHEGREVLGMVTDISVYNHECIVRIFSGPKKGMFYAGNISEFIAVSHESALEELIRQKKEWKENKQYSNE